jgi:hypothetical protein
MDEKLDDALKGTFPASDPFDLSDEGGSNYASPPCFMHELDSGYLGYLSRFETIALLIRLLEVERAGDPAIAEMGRAGAGVPDPAASRGIAKDEAGFCAMLTRHITRLGGTPGPQTGAIYGKPLALDPYCEPIELPDRGQALIVRKLQEALPKIGDGALHRDLKIMLDVHERKIQRCKKLR